MTLVDQTRTRRAPAPSRQMLADHVYDAVLDLLIDGELKAGAALGIDGLAREFGVSQTPVREALARLESTGLVRRTALKGYRVAPVATPEELVRLMQARLVLEPALAEMAAERLTPQVLADLEQAVHDLATAPLGPAFHEFRQYWEADERFHRIIAEATGNEFLLSAYQALGGQIQRFRLFGGGASPTPTTASPSTPASWRVCAPLTRPPPTRRWPPTSPRRATAPSGRTTPPPDPPHPTRRSSPG